MHYLHANEGGTGDNTVAEEKKRKKIYICMCDTAVNYTVIFAGPNFIHLCVFFVCLFVLSEHLISPGVKWKYIHLAN